MADRSHELGSDSPEAQVIRDFVGLVEELTDTQGMFDDEPEVAEVAPPVERDYLLRVPFVVDTLILNSFSVLNSPDRPGRTHVVSLRTGMKNPGPHANRPDVTFITAPDQQLAFHGPSREITGLYHERDPLEQQETLEKYRELCDHLRREIAAGLIPE